MSASCGTCLYHDETLHCRRLAPTASMGSEMQGVWPRVETSDWCGEWRDQADDFRTDPPESVISSAVRQVAAAIAEILPAGL